MTDRQFVIEPLNGQSVNIRSGGQIVGRLTFVSSRVTGSTAGAAASLVTWAGNGQSAVAGATVTPPAVRVLDANGLPVAGSTVTWEGNTISGATQQGLTGTSDSNGVVTLGGWSVGTTAASTYTVFAYSGNLTNSPIRFSITPTAGSAFSVGVSAGDIQSSTPLSLLASRLTALVQDQYGNNVTGASVTWTSSSADATFSASTSATNASGLAGIVYTTGQSASTESVWAAISSVTSTRFGIGVTAAQPTGLDIVAGDGQTALSGTTLATDPLVQVQDPFGNLWSSGQTVQFVLVAGGGNLSRATATPNASGQASVGWKLGTTEAINLLEVSLANVSNSTVTFTASGTNPAADTIQLESGNNQTGTVNMALALPLAVALKGSGSSSSGQAVAWSTTAGSLSTTQTISSTSGVARTVLTLPTTVGTVTVNASAGTLSGSPVVFTATATAGSATSLVLVTQPTSAPQPGVAWSQQPVVASTDVFGNLVSTNTRVGAVLVTGDGTLGSGVSTFATASGATATFSGLSYTYVSTLSFQVAFRCNSLSTATASVQTSQPPFANKVAFTQQPTGGLVGVGIGTVLVAIQDSLGGTVPSATDAVTVALTSSANTEGATLSGTATVNAVGGVATFTNLSVNSQGAYTLDATATGLTGATSASFSVISSAYNEPVGMVTVTGSNRSFNSKAGSAGDTAGAENWDTIERNYSNWSIIADSTAVLSPASVANINYPAGFAGGSAPATLQRTVTLNTYRTLYHRFAFWISSNFTGHPTSTNKIFHLWMGGSGEALGNKAFYSMEGNGLGTLSFQYRLQGSKDTRPRLTANTGNSAPISRGSWNVVETLTTTNSRSAISDGIVKVWLNGVQTHNYSDVNFSGSTMTWYIGQVQLSPTWGGAGSTTSEAQQLRIDHCYFSVRTV